MAIGGVDGGDEGRAGAEEDEDELAPAAGDDRHSQMHSSELNSSIINHLYIHMIVVHSFRNLIKGKGPTDACIVMVETVSSAVVQETVNRILSGLVQKYEKYESDSNKNLERLEMAHIRLEAALETSYKWQIFDASLLRWRKKLKRAAQECNDTLQKCKRRVLEDESIEQQVRNSSLSTRIAHATKSVVFSIFSGNNNELSCSTVQRFEWFAAGASEFLRFVELGGAPRRYIPFQSLVKNLLGGKNYIIKYFGEMGIHCLNYVWCPSVLQSME
ncbi:hypothetical protein EJB05_09228, partial [Eragrostis curvula]